jgi:hypothetical protein
LSVLPDGSSEPVVGSSTQGTTNFESTTFARPEGSDGSLAPGKYVVRVVNFAAVEPYDGKISFHKPPDFVPATTETWQFSCSYNGEKRVTEDFLIGRGERKKVDLSDCGLAHGGGRCAGVKATLVGSRGDDKMVGTNKRDVIVGLGGKDKIKGRGGNDLICAKGGDDRLVGGKGNDKVGGGGGRDRVSGSSGNDLLKGGARADRLAGGGGDDRLIGGGGRDKLNGGGGKDRCSGRRDHARNC